MADFLEAYLQKYDSPETSSSVQPLTESSGDPLEQYLAKYDALPEQPAEQQSWQGVAGREALASAIPSGAGMAAGTATAIALAPTSVFTGGIPVIPAIGGLIAGFGASYGTEKLQDKAGEAIAPEQWQAFQRQRAEGMQQHPLAAFAGGLVPQALTFKAPSLKELRTIRNIIKVVSTESADIAKKELAKPGSAEALARLANMAVGSGMQGGQELAQQIITGNPDAIRLAGSFLAGVVLSKPRDWTPRILGGEASKPVIEGENALAGPIAGEQAKAAMAEPSGLESQAVPEPAAPVDPIRAQVEAMYQQNMERGIPPALARKNVEIVYNELIRQKAQAAEPAPQEQILPPPAEETPPVTLQTAEQTGQKEMAPAMEADLQKVPREEPAPAAKPRELMTPGADLQEPIPTENANIITSEQDKYIKQRWGSLDNFIADYKARSNAKTEGETHKQFLDRMMSEDLQRETAPSPAPKKALAEPQKADKAAQQHVAIYNGKEVSAESFKQAARRVSDNLATGDHGYVRDPSGKLFEVASDNKMAIPVEEMRTKVQREIAKMEERIANAKYPNERKVLTERLNVMKAAMFAEKPIKPSKERLTPEQLRESIKPATEEQVSGLKARGYTDEQIKAINTTKADEILAATKPVMEYAIGAASAAEKAPGTPIEQLKEVIASKDKIDLSTVPDTFSLKQYVQREVTRAKSEGKGIYDQAITSMKATWKYLKELQKGLPGDSARDQAVARHQGTIGMIERNAVEHMKAISSKIPSQKSRNAIAAWVDAGGDSAKLKIGEREAPDKYKQAYKDAQNLTPDEINIAQNIEQYFSSMADEALKAEVITAVRDNFIHRMVRQDPTKAQELKTRMGALVHKDPRTIAHTRQFAHDWEAMKWAEEPGNGYNIEQDFLKRVMDYDLEVKRVLNDRRLKQDLSKSVESDGRRSLISMQERIKMLEEIKASNPKDDISHLDTRDYVPVLDDNSNPMFAHPQAVDQIKSLYEKSRVPYNPIANAALKVGSEFKQTMLSASLFHPVQLMVHGLEHKVMPWEIAKQNIDFSGKTPESIKQVKLMEAGLEISGSEALRNMMEGNTGGGGLIGKVPVIGDFMAKMNHLTFEEFLPRLKMSMALHALERNRTRYASDISSGKMSEFQLHRLTAEQANAAFGGLNYKLLGRSQTAQDWFRLFALAPDFLEARGRFVGQAFTQYGGEQRAALMLGAGVLYTIARIMNMAISGRPHNELENAFSVVVDGKAYSLRTLQGDIMHLVKDPGAFARGRANPFTTRTGIELLTSRDYFGRKRTYLEQMQDLIKSIMPISLRGLMPEERKYMGMMQIMGNSFGFSAKKFDNVKSIYALAQDWKKAAKVPERGEFIYNPNTDPYRDIKLALSQRDDVAAVKGIIESIKEHGMTPMKLTEHFARYANSKFTGSVMNEQKFLRTLNTEQKEAYKEAVKEKHDIFKQFLKARNLYLSERNKPLKIDSTGDIEMSNIGDEQL